MYLLGSHFGSPVSLIARDSEVNCTLMLKGPFLTEERLRHVYTRIKADSHPVHFYAKEGEARIMYASMADLQEGLELTQKTDSFGGGKGLNVEILQWHSNHHFYGEYFNDEYFEKEIKRLGQVDQQLEPEPNQSLQIEESTGDSKVTSLKLGKDHPKNILERKMHLKKKKQQLQRSMDIWENQQGEETIPEVILKPIAQTVTQKPSQVPTIQILEPEPESHSTSQLVESIPIIQFDLLPVETETSKQEPAPAKEPLKFSETLKPKKKKLTFFNSEEEEQQKDTFIESKSAFEFYLDSLTQESAIKTKYTRCNLCKANFGSALELSVHVAFDNAHKMILQEKLECVSFQKN